MIPLYSPALSLIYILPVLHLFKFPSFHLSPASPWPPKPSPHRPPLTYSTQHIHHTHRPSRTPIITSPQDPLPHCSQDPIQHNTHAKQKQKSQILDCSHTRTHTYTLQAGLRITLHAPPHAAMYLLFVLECWRVLVCVLVPVFVAAAQPLPAPVAATAAAAASLSEAPHSAQRSLHIPPGASYMMFYAAVS